MADSTRGSFWSEERWARFAPLTGALAVILWVVSVVIIEAVADTPDDEASPADIASYYNEDANSILIAGYLFMLGAAVFIWFLGSLRARLAAAEGGVQRLTAVVFGTGIALAAMLMASQAPNVGAALVPESTDAEIDAGSARAFWDIGDGFFVAATAVLAIFFLASGVAILRTRSLPAWLGIATLVLGVVALIAPIGWAVLLFAFPVWVLVVVAVLMANRPGGTAEPRAPAAAA